MIIRWSLQIRGERCHVNANLDDDGGRPSLAARESRFGSAASQSASLHFSLRSLVTTSLLLNNNKANHVCSRRSPHRAYSTSLDGPASPRLGSSSHLRKLTMGRRTLAGVCNHTEARPCHHLFAAGPLLADRVDHRRRARLLRESSRLRCADRLPFRASSAPTSFSDPLC